MICALHCLLIFHVRVQAQARMPTQPDSATVRKHDGATLVRELKNTLRNTSPVPDPVTSPLNSTDRDNRPCGLDRLLTNSVEVTFTPQGVV